MSTRRYTSVTAVFERDRINVRLRFARPVRERQLDRRRRLVLFAPNSVFALLRWENGPFGTNVSHITVMRTVEPGETCSVWPYVHPGAKTLLFVSGWHQVERALKTVDAIEALSIDPAEASPEYWQHVHNRLWSRQSPRAYSHEQHAAWLRRRKLLS